MPLTSSWPRLLRESRSDREVCITRVFISVTDAVRRNALTRALRTDPAFQVVARESDADVVVADAEPQRTPLGAVDAEQRAPAAPARKGQTLTPRERDVLLLVAGGMGNARIGEQLGISKSTVKFHLGATFTKLGVHTRAEAVTMGIRSGIVLV